MVASPTTSIAPAHPSPPSRPQQTSQRTDASAVDYSSLGEATLEPCARGDVGSNEDSRLSGGGVNCGQKDGKVGGAATTRQPDGFLGGHQNDAGDVFIDEFMLLAGPDTYHAHRMRESHERETHRLTRRYLTHALLISSRHNINWLPPTSEADARLKIEKVLQKCVEEGSSAAELNGIRAALSWVIDNAYVPAIRLRTITRAFQKNHPKTEAKPTAPLDVTPVLRLLAQKQWAASSDPGISNVVSTLRRAVTLTFIFGGMRFAELARMRWEEAERTDRYWEFVVKTKTSTERKRCRLFHLSEMLDICPYAALDEAFALARGGGKGLGGGRNVQGPVWADAQNGPWSAPLIGKQIAAVEIAAGLPGKNPYRLKHAVADALKKLGISDAELAKFFRHSLSSNMAQRHYLSNDRGEACSHALAGLAFQ